VSILQAIVLGIVQGITEFLPISSTAHLRIVPAFLGWDDPGAAFTAVTQLGTLAAVLIYFRHDIVRILVAWVRSLRNAEVRRTLDARLGWYILLGTIPIGIAGIVFSDQIENNARSLYLIGTTMVVMGVLLLLADRSSRQARDVDDLNKKDAAVIGVAQACALIPGVSRSGATLTAGLFLGLNRYAAARYSFLLSVPAVVLSGLYELKDIGGEGSVGAAPTAVATVCAFIAGYASIAFLLRYLSTHTTGIFVAYRVAVGVLVLALTATGTIS
jgi:undecaprenyl-diphosphatase